MSITENKRIILTGFMGVGKSSVAKHVSYMIRAERCDLDELIERRTSRSVTDIVENDGVEDFRKIETDVLAEIVCDTDIRIISLGGGAWMNESNRELIKQHGLVSIWLESTFEHCWANISASKKDRPLARKRAMALKLFEERQPVYCLADWHFLIQSGLNSFAVARQIAEQVFSHER
jgi:shikimate kinase